jgi:hypothetical protein
MAEHMLTHLSAVLLQRGVLSELATASYCS